jgi:hypothetical protein
MGHELRLSSENRMTTLPPPRSSSPWRRWWPGGLLVFHTVFVHLESFSPKLLLVALVVGLRLWLALLILRGVIAHFERFRWHSLPSKCRRIVV